MVDTIGVEIFGHLLETVFPPGITVQLHHLPIIGRKAPILTIWRESIRRSTGLGVEIEERWMGLGLYAIEIHANGDIAFQDNAFGTGVISSRLQLEMKMILGEVDE